MAVVLEMAEEYKKKRKRKGRIGKGRKDGQQSECTIYSQQSSSGVYGIETALIL